MRGAIICVIVYLGLIAARWRLTRLRRYSEGARRTIRILLAFNTLALALFLVNARGRTVTSLTRGKPGTGSATHELEMEVEDVVDGQKVPVRISERAYTAEQEQAYLADCKKRLRKQMLGGNEKASQVTKDLDLTQRISGNPTRIDWRADRSDVISGEGKILSAAVEESGTAVALTAHLTCGKTQEEITIPVTVYPRDLTDQASYIDAVDALVERADKVDETGKKVRLPETVGDKKVRWRREAGKGGYLILILGAVCAVALYEEKREKQKREKKRRAQLIETDYPRIVTTFSLLFRAGLTSRRALEMIATDYENRRDSTGRRPAYEALAAGMHQMAAGISQEEVYLSLGRVCDSARFERFGNLLAQNLRRGTGGLADQLAREAENCFKERLSRARKKGEEAQIKLLLPMLLLFGVVLMAVMVPAFLSMQM